MNHFRDQIVVVTGARGFIGSHVAAQLVRAGAKVRGLSRQTVPPEGDIQWFQADLTSPETLVEPMRDARYLFHVAGDYRFWAPDPQSIYRNNVLGTDHILQAAARVGVEKIIVTSTQGILEPGSIDHPGDETRPIPPAQLHGPYKSSKVAAHGIVQRHLGDGAPIVSVLPGAPIGEHDLRPTPTGAIIVRFLNGQLPLLARTGLSFVEVADVARGHLLAVAHGEVGQDYLLAGHNLWLGEFLQLLAPHTRHRVPTRYAPVWLSRLAAFMSENWHRISGSDAEPFITRESVRMSERPYFFSSEKAIRDLGYRLSPLAPAIARAVADFRSRGVVGRKS